jgi:hypothetical protein
MSYTTRTDDQIRWAAANDPRITDLLRAARAASYAITSQLDDASAHPLLTRSEVDAALEHVGGLFKAVQYARLAVEAELRAADGG